MAKLRRTVDGIGVEGLDMSDQPDPVFNPSYVRVLAGNPDDLVEEQVESRVASSVRVPEKGVVVAPALATLHRLQPSIARLYSSKSAGKSKSAISILLEDVESLGVKKD